jgi:hypothetical protein
MKSLKFVRTIPGAAMIFAMLATGSVGVYALTNWFGGNVTVTQRDPSIFSVDLSSCKGHLPAGVEPTDDPHDVQFKIIGNPHISASDLQQNLLGECEGGAVANFYSQKFPDAHFSTPSEATVNSRQYTLLSAVVQAINTSGTVTLAPIANTKNLLVAGPQTFNLASNVTAYNEGATTPLQSVKAGDHVTAVMYAAGDTSRLEEGVSILNDSNVEVESIFKTQYGGTDGQSGFYYEAANVMPLDMYRGLHAQATRTTPSPFSQR